MNSAIKPVQVQSLKAACVQRLEALILSGQFKIGSRLPPERELAAALDVSRPVLHEALVDLTTKGLVRIVPRHGAFINDFRTSGSLALLSSLLAYNDGELDPPLAQSLIDMRLLLECETARLAALNRTPEHLQQFQMLLVDEMRVRQDDPQALTDLDFQFHLLVSIASGNLIYPLMLNSFKPVYTNLTGAFFRLYCPGPVVEEVLKYHSRLAAAIQAGDGDQAAQLMAEMLRSGEQYLKGE